MYRVFNMGIGLILVVSPRSADAMVTRLVAMGEQAALIGEVVTGTAGEADVQYAD